MSAALCWLHSTWKQEPWNRFGHVNQSSLASWPTCQASRVGQIPGNPGRAGRVEPAVNTTEMLRNPFKRADLPSLTHSWPTREPPTLPWPPRTCSGEGTSGASLCLLPLKTWLLQLHPPSQGDGSPLFVSTGSPFTSISHPSFLTHGYSSVNIKANMKPKRPFLVHKLNFYSAPSL